MIIKEKISPEELERIFTNSSYDKVVKFVADIEKEILSIGCDFHMECAEELTEKEESRQKNLWGANLYKDGRIDFVSLINIKPLENNRSMEIQDIGIKKKVEEITKKLLCK
ncbi:MAG: hypothetical protein HY773_02485 [Candidatus Terrybacteria bacterium]|nr:hypothetical protein [Candidatus Terrybacteria bacterium]